MQLKREGIPYIISAPSGTGKSTVCQILLERLANLKISISHTTRPPRPTEAHGKDYYFVSEKEFNEKIKANAFLEWAKVHNEYYGTSKHSIEKIQNDGYDVIIEIDVQGADILRKMGFEGVYIFLLPPSLKELKNRLTKRSTESAEKIQQRMEVAEKEITEYKNYFYIVTNFEIEDTVGKLSAIMQAEKQKMFRYVPTSPDLETIINPQGT
jgi:guanylate kinase